MTTVKQWKEAFANLPDDAEVLVFDGIKTYIESTEGELPVFVNDEGIKKYRNKVLV